MSQRFNITIEEDTAAAIKLFDEAGMQAQLAESSEYLADFSEALPRPLGVSIGIALFDLDSNEAVDDLLVRADRAMYAAKRNPEQEYSLALPAEQSNMGGNDSAIG